jgi:hypothetical protein
MTGRDQLESLVVISRCAQGNRSKGPLEHRCWQALQNIACEMILLRGELAALRITVKDAQEPRPHGRGTKERGAGAAHDHKEAKQNGLSGIAFSPCESASQAFRFQSG